MSDPLSALRGELGLTLYSDWVVVDQAMIDSFAEATRDHQFIHVDPARAAKTPFGGTIAHGFLSLSLLSFLQESISRPVMRELKMGVNYGFDRIRFLSPVKSNSHIRLASKLITIDEKAPLTFQLTHDIEVEIQGMDKPALKAAWITRLSFREG
jgi:acyl dehydratase